MMHKAIECFARRRAPLCPHVVLLLGHDVTADVPADGEDENRVGREEAQRRRRESRGHPRRGVVHASWDVFRAIGFPAASCNGSDHPPFFFPALLASRKSW